MSTTTFESAFIQTYNPIKGKLEWNEKPRDYDYQREVARSAYADMLHDYERNRLYYVGLKAAVRKKKEEGQEVHVLDIGTGTGLLSMMAAQIGVDSITACEEFNPIANVAERVIRSNGYSDKIKLVRKRSTNVEVGPGKDMEQRANILVTEVFDTELIGEGAIGTFNHAHKELLTEDCLVVPCEGTMYAQIVQSDLASRWNDLHPIKSSKWNLIPPAAEGDDESGISSALALHDVQLTQMKPDWFSPITDPVPIFKFDFSSRKSPIPVNELNVVSTRAKRDGSCDAIFIWWDAYMDPKKKILLSCAPIWAHPDKEKTKEDIPWRNHWMQAIYYPREKILVKAGEHISILGDHNEYSLMFDVSKKAPKDISSISNIVPYGGIHQAGISRTRLGQMNDSRRNKNFISALETFSLKNNRPLVILSISDLSLLPLIAGAASNTSKIYISKQNNHMKALLEGYIRCNAILSVERFVFLEKDFDALTLEDIPEKIDIIIGEPHFSTCYLPWHNLFYWYQIHEFIKNLDESIEIMPKKLEVYAIPVEFKDLWKIRSPLGEVEGFKMKHFDDVIMNACDIGDADVEPQPLWEYPCIARSDSPIKLLSFDLRSPVSDLSSNVSMPASGKINGMAIWANWYLTDDITISGGPLDPALIKSGHYIEWDIHSHQGVYFFKDPSSQCPGDITVECRTSFNAFEGDIGFSFSLNRTL